MTLSMDNIQTQTTPIQPSPAADGFLKRLANSMKTRARQQPNTPIYPFQPLTNKAQLVLRFENGIYRLRIARTGLSPLNDWSSKGSSRLKAWRREVHTFCREFGFADHDETGASDADGARELIYYVDVAWAA